MLEEIRNRVGKISRAPWKAVHDHVNGFLLTVAVESTDRVVVNDTAGLVHGASKFTVDLIRADSDFIVNAPVDVLTLIRALDIATAGDQQKLDFIVVHAHKEVLQELGIIPDPPVLKKV